MKRHFYLFALFLSSFFVFFFSCSDKPLSLFTAESGTGSKVVAVSFAPAEEISFSPVKLTKTSAAGPFILSGDVRNDKMPELILADGNTVTVYTPEGTELASKTFQHAVFHRGITADIDGDKKQEIILGAAEDKNGRLFCVNGFLKTVFDKPLFEMSRGNTIPVFYEAGIIYFFAASAYYISPKTIGAYSIPEEKLLWRYDLGPVPTAVAASSSGGDRQNGRLLAVSHRAVSREWRDAETNLEIPKEQQGLLLLNGGGKPVNFTSIGPAAKTGYFVEKGISGIQQKMFDINGDGDDEVILAVERLSELYTGTAELQIRDTKGKLLDLYRGPEKTEASFGFFSAGKKRRILLSWKQKGTVVLLNDELEESAVLRLPGTYHEAEIQSIADIDGNGRVDFLISDWDRLHITDDKLRIQWSFHFPNKISGTALLQGKGGTVRIGVIANDMYLLFPGGPDTPKGMTVTAFQETPKNAGGLPEADTSKIPETYYKDVELLIPPPPEKPAPDYAAYALAAEGVSPPGFLHKISDFLGGPEKELFFFDRNSNTATVLNSRLEPLTSFQLDRGESGRYILCADIDGNGKTDLVTHRYKPYGFVARNALGEIINSRLFAYGYDTWFGLPYVSENLWIFGVDTGYMLAPRGYYGYNPLNDSITFFYPTAVSLLSFGMLHNQDTIFGSARTVSNGAELTLADGKTDSDRALFLHVFDEAGGIQPGTRQLQHKDNTGNLQPFSFDFDGNGQDEVYFQEGKYEGYYEGTCRLYRFNEEVGSLSVVYEAAQERNGNPSPPRPFLGNGEKMLALLYNRPSYVELIDSGFSLHRRFEPEVPGHPEELFHTGFITFHDLDSDNTSELFAMHSGGLYVLDLTGNTIRVLTVPDPGNDPLRRYGVEDLDLDGKPEIVLCTEKRIFLYGY